MASLRSAEALTARTTGKVVASAVLAALLGGALTKVLNTLTSSVQLFACTCVLIQHRASIDLVRTLLSRCFQRQLVAVHTQSGTALV